MADYDSKSKLLEMLAKYLTKNDYDKAEELLDDAIEYALSNAMSDW